MKSNMKFPNYSDYCGFGQLEDGVGMVPLFDHDFNKELNYLKNKILEGKVDIFEKKKITLITGKITEDYIVKKSKRIMKVFKNIDINVIAIENDYFGHDINCNWACSW